MTKPTIPVSKLEPVETFEKNDALVKSLAIIPDADRRALLAKIYRLAARKVAMDQLREHAWKRAPDLRKSIDNHRKIRICLQKAVKNITEGRQTAEDPELLKNFDVDEAQRLIELAINDVRWVEEHMFPGMIHAQLRKNGEIHTTLRLPSSEQRLPGFGYAQTDHWLIRELEKSLQECTMTQKIKKGELVDLIVVVFKAAFSESRSRASIESALRNRSSSRKPSGQK
jgi:hypothetical protein